MAVGWDFQTSGAFRLVYHRLHVGDPEQRRIRAPMIAPIEVPIALTGRALVVGASYMEARPSWRIAGSLMQVLGGLNVSDALVFPGLSAQPTTSADSARRTVALNRLELHIFPRLATDHYYVFEPVRWMPRLTLTVWEYVGSETDSLEELIQSIQVDIARLEFKVDRL